jgi:hypothetical protein
MNINTRCSLNIATQIATIVPDHETQLLVDLLSFIKESYATIPGAPDSVSVTTRCFAVAPLHPLNQHYHVSSMEISKMTQLQNIIMNHISEINVQWKADVLDIFHNQTPSTTVYGSLQNK